MYTYTLYISSPAVPAIVGRLDGATGLISGSLLITSKDTANLAPGFSPEKVTLDSFISAVIGGGGDWRLLSSERISVTR